MLDFLLGSVFGLAVGSRNSADGRVLLTGTALAGVNAAMEFCFRITTAKDAVKLLPKFENDIELVENPRPVPDFEIVIERENNEQNWGFGALRSEGTYLRIESLESFGAVLEYNESAMNTVCSGDKLLIINGVYGSPDRMQNEIASKNKLLLSIKRAAPHDELSLTYQPITIRVEKEDVDQSITMSQEAIVEQSITMSQEEVVAQSNTISLVEEQEAEEPEEPENVERVSLSEGVDTAVPEEVCIQTEDMLPPATEETSQQNSENCSLCC